MHLDPKDLSKTVKRQNHKAQHSVKLQMTLPAILYTASCTLRRGSSQNVWTIQALS